ncbi:MAG: Gfo/Idh/MocA family oxidoreductase [Verrucomicrobiales bacterium]|nr:Gfo/Idh/MocA family oxidoreductase [Verrucomicrobiales bacterium]
MEKQTSRRNFVKGAVATAAAFNFQVVPSRVFGANDKINLAGIGISGKGASDIGNSAGAGFNISHLCDIVDKDKYPNVGGNWVKTRENYPDAKFYDDWREMLEAEGDKIDAVTVSTPDHVHAHASVAAMKKGCAVYCQKPLTHGIWEARKLTEYAAETGVVTQMGNQAHAEDHMRRVVELVRAGLIGDVTEVHAWTNRPIWPQGIPEWPEGEEPPKHINWDLWLGPAEYVPYSSKIAPFKWRGYWNFGTGALGDMACHIMDLSYWAADLGAPTSVKAVSADGRGAQSEVSPPTWATIEYEFPKRGDKPPVKYTWYDGYKDAVFNPEKWSLESNIDGGKIRERNLPPKDILEGFGGGEKGGYGCVLIGTQGKIWFNRGKDNWVVKPGNLTDGFDFPKQSIPRARDEDPHKEFYDAIKAGDPELPQSNFAQSGPFTEMVLLGNLAVRLNKKVKWDSENLTSPNTPEAAELIKREYRDGWALGI